MPNRCCDCGAPLTLDEQTYYGAMCERCEGEAFHREEAAFFNDEAHLRAIARAQFTDRAIEACAALFGLLGAFLLATRSDVSAWGWVAFLASNAGWIAFAVARRLWWLLVQQIGFTATSLLGIWRWLL
jgi:hypothetical protein